MVLGQRSDPPKAGPRRQARQASMEAPGVGASIDLACCLRDAEAARRQATSVDPSHPLAARRGTGACRLAGRRR